MDGYIQMPADAIDDAFQRVKDGTWSERMNVKLRKNNITPYYQITDTQLTVKLIKIVDTSDIDSEIDTSDWDLLYEEGSTSYFEVGHFTVDLSVGPIAKLTENDARINFNHYLNMGATASATISIADSYIGQGYARLVNGLFCYIIVRVCPDIRADQIFSIDGDGSPQKELLVEISPGQFKNIYITYWDSVGFRVMRNGYDGTKRDSVGQGYEKSVPLCAMSIATLNMPVGSGICEIQEPVQIRTAKLHQSDFYRGDEAIEHIEAVLKSAGAAVTKTPSEDPTLEWLDKHEPQFALTSSIKPRKKKLVTRRLRSARTLAPFGEFSSGSNKEDGTVPYEKYFTWGGKTYKKIKKTNKRRKTNKKGRY